MHIIIIIFLYEIIYLNLVSLKLINTNLTKLSLDELLHRAKKFSFHKSVCMDDGSSKLAVANSKYGLAKIHYAQQSLGFEPNACFIATPDQTITRNDYRWNFGSTYGGKYVWGKGNDKIIFPDLKPNSCGIIVGALNELPNEKEIIERVIGLRNDETYLNDIKIKWDFEKSNHFIDIYEKKLVTPNKEMEEENSVQFNNAQNKIENYKYFFMIHCSAPEMKKVSPGMYIDDSKELQNMCEVISTPFGDCNVLLDDSAVKYYDFCKKANDFSQQRRVLAGEKIFGDFEVISNANHQGMLNDMNSILLGAQSTKDFPLLPIVLKADAIAYLAMGLPNFSEEQIEENGWSKRAEHRELSSTILNSNIMPHGGGYALEDILSVNKVLSIDNIK